MGHSVTLGGERVGSGSKSKVYLRNYERSTHNLSYDWLSTMGCGMLIPFMCELVTRDDKYEINLNAGLRTIPTKGPLFGSFKMQLDVYQCPLRLYQALLHNNPLAIGLKANQVKFPKIRLYGTTEIGTHEAKAANNSLVKYLGISGIGTITNTDDQQNPYRDLFGAHVLAYYDIFKNYYANKQEENAYTLGIDKRNTSNYNKLVYSNSSYYDYEREGLLTWVEWDENENAGRTGLDIPWSLQSKYKIYFSLESNGSYKMTKEDLLNQKFNAIFKESEETQPYTITRTLQTFIDDYNWSLDWNDETNQIVIEITNKYSLGEGHWGRITYLSFHTNMYETEEEVILVPFELSNIDDMRYSILSFHQLGQSFILDGDQAGTSYAPYVMATGDSSELDWQKPLSGICVKTYQSDIFNNWLNTEIIDGENGIAEITAISTSSGSITIDQLQFSEKLYNLLNRIAVSGGTYQDYLDAAYTTSAKRFEESPIWIGGMSDEVVFEEIVQTAPAGDGILGTLGGRGNLMGKQKGGRITVKIDEPSLLIGIVSITPRIVYTQGNKWFNTEIDSLQDIHVPALDAIGFQNLMAETMHFGSTIIEDGDLQERPIIGKIPAWLHYMTNYDQAYGDFAATDGDGFMVLNRNYDCVNGELQDATTYIDPAKFNYAFGYAKREAQNFWVKIKCSIKARRLMSAKQIPTA